MYIACRILEIEPSTTLSEIPIPNPGALCNNNARKLKEEGGDTKENLLIPKGELPNVDLSCRSDVHLSPLFCQSC